MDNSDLIFSYNTSTLSNILMKKRVCTIKCHAHRLTATPLLRIVKSINGVAKKYDGIKPTIDLDLSGAVMEDKLVYILLENICYATIKKKGYPIRLRLNQQDMIQASGFKYSPLQLLCQDKTTIEENCNNYVSYYEAKLNVSTTHYRRIVSKNEKVDSDIFCTIMSDVRSFLRLFYGDLKRIQEIAEVVAELCGNAWEHSHSDCLIDLDVANDFMRADKSDDYLYGCINIVILNLSEQLIGDGLQKKILSADCLDERYKTVRDAYDFHRPHFDETYTEETFWGIAAFQDKISGRPEWGKTGGTGLPRMIRSIEKGFEGLHCYCCSGNSFIIFLPSALEYSKEGWIGFNQNGEFKSGLPMPGIVGHNEFYLPGTGFNLAFDFRRDEVIA